MWSKLFAKLSSDDRKLYHSRKTATASGIKIVLKPSTRHHSGNVTDYNGSCTSAEEETNQISRTRMMLETPDYNNEGISEIAHQTRTTPIRVSLNSDQLTVQPHKQHRTLIITDRRR